MARNKINPDPPSAAPKQMSQLKCNLIFIIVVILLIVVGCFFIFQKKNFGDYQITSLVSTNTTPQMWIITFGHLSDDCPLLLYTQFQLSLFYIHDNRDNNSHSNYNNSGKSPKYTLIAQSYDLTRQGLWNMITNPITLYPPKVLATRPLSFNVPFQVGISVQYSIMIVTNSSMKKFEKYNFLCTYPYLTIVFDNVTGSGLTAMDLPKYCS